MRGSLALGGRGESDAGRVSQARPSSRTLEDVNGQVHLATTDIPGETQTGIAVDAAVISTTGVLAQTTGQPFSSAVLGNLTQRVTHAHGPVWADLVDSRGIPRRAYAVPLSDGSTSGPVLIVSRPVAEMQNTLRRTLLFLPVVAAILLVFGCGGDRVRAVVGKIKRKTEGKLP